MKIFFLFLLSFIIIGCNSNKVKIIKSPNSIVINEISITIPKSWSKDNSLKLWREKHSGAIINIETESSILSLQDYMTEALDVIKKVYSYIEIDKNMGKIDKYPYLDSVAEIEIEDRIMLVHTLIIDKDNLKITLTIAVNKKRVDMVNSDFNYIINNLKLRGNL